MTQDRIVSLSLESSHLAAFLNCQGVFFKLGQQLSCHGAHLVLSQLSILAGGESTVAGQLKPRRRERTHVVKTIRRFLIMEYFT